ncbi:uncharacterized protein LAJ45_05863 [Morchella importuna]|uniref:uncharacterized protein n=1 Tax=Morchella importuna TaxID=1174673 RepID=UPI001E8E02B5|nr:uncharacterized protein LAJ45_05863 [Morchella importuna]KAH8150177.1 hypothetical protein LAJ45_05863 [Morchella importuna]
MWSSRRNKKASAERTRIFARIVERVIRGTGVLGRRKRLHDANNCKMGRSHKKSMENISQLPKWKQHARGH